MPNELFLHTVCIKFESKMVDQALLGIFMTRKAICNTNYASTKLSLKIITPVVYIKMI